LGCLVALLAGLASKVTVSIGVLLVLWSLSLPVTFDTESLLL
jgi:hypothetical protein